MKELTEMSNAELFEHLNKINKEFNMRKKIPIKSIINNVSDYIGYDITDNCRTPEYTFARFCMFNYLRNNGCKLTEIARAFNKNHSTVSHGLNTYLLLKQQDLPDFMDIDRKIKRALYENRESI